MANEVFISYSRADHAKVASIKEEIDREVGINCWMDLNGIESGEQFVKVIVSAINKHDTLLFMQSKSSMESEWALNELKLANKKQKRIVLVDIDHSEMTDEFYMLYSTKDNIDWSNRLQHDKLIRNLKSWCNKGDEEKKGKIAEEEIKEKKNDMEKYPPVLLHRAEGIGYYNFIGPDGNVVLNKHYHDAYSFKEGLAPVAIEAYNYGYIDKTGKIVIKPQWEEANIFSEGLAAVKKANDCYGYIDRMGKTIIPPNWESAGDFHENLAPVSWGTYYGGKGGYIDKTGRLVIQASDSWYWWFEFSNGLAPIRNNKARWGFINTEGTEVIPCKWKEAGSFFEGLAAVKDIRGEWCYIDTKGNIKIPANSKWKYAGPFGNGLAPVKNWDEQWGYINTKGELVIDYKWFEAERFEQGVAWVKTSYPWRLINTNGEFVNKIQQ